MAGDADLIYCAIAYLETMIEVAFAQGLIASPLAWWHRLEEGLPGRWRYPGVRAA